MIAIDEARSALTFSESGCIGAQRCTRMRRSAFLLSFLGFSMFAASFAQGCSSGSTETASAQVLDPTQPHYGNSDDEWCALWWQWIYQLPQTENDAGMPNCIIPFQDPTGANCGYGQSGDVFFFTGTSGGTVVRDQCFVPAGKAIFFPILTATADNAGTPVAMQLSDTDLMAQVQAQIDGVSVASLSAEFDGLPIPNLARFKTQTTKYSYTLPPEPNDYTCEGAPGITGLVDPSYAACYAVMLPPPTTGAHVLHFAGSSPKSNPPWTVDVTYHFTVQ